MLWKIGRLTQEIAPPQTLVQNNTIQVFEHPEYITAITALTAALRPFPEARKAAAEALRSINGHGSRFSLRYCSRPASPATMILS
jgi:hypothetical protein